MAKKPVTKEEILKQLKNSGVTDLESFADFVVKKANAPSDEGKPVVASFIAIDHGVVSH